MNKQSKKRSVIILALLLVLSSAIGFTSAIFKLNTDRRNNSLLFGDVNIELSEEKWEKVDKNDKGQVLLYPGRTVNKDPQVKNTGKNDAYVFLRVSVPKATVETVNDDETIATYDKPQQLFTYAENNENWTKIESGTESNTDYNIYVYGYNEILKPGEQTTNALFNEVKFLNIVEGSIKNNTVLEIKVEALAVQSDFLDLDDTSPETVYNTKIKPKQSET